MIRRIFVAAVVMTASFLVTADAEAKLTVKAYEAVAVHDGHVPTDNCCGQRLH